jgi:two-component system response regulator NreC
MINSRKNLSILIADDHELVRRGIRGLIEAQGWRVMGEASDGVEAVAKAKRTRPDIAIIDIEMPQLDGLQAIHQIRQVAPDTKIVTLTVHQSRSLLRRVLEAGAVGYVTKSDLSKELIRAIRNVAHGEVFFTPTVCKIVVSNLIEAKAGDDVTRGGEQPTSRERQVIRLLAEGKANKEIATALGISVRTAETHRSHIMQKLGLRTVVEVVHYAIREGMISARNS